jgi:hypothetical protein
LTRRDRLLTEAVHHASSLLSKNGEFYPLALVCTADRGPDQLAVALSDDQPSAARYREELERGLRHAIRTSSPPVVLVALVRNVTATDTQQGASADAISVHIEGLGDRSATLCFVRYSLTDGEVELDDPVAQHEALRFFR